MSKEISKELIIIGGGPAGLRAAEEAQYLGIDYVILEKGQAGQAWREIRPDMKLLSPCHPQRDWTSVSDKFPIWKLGVTRPYCDANEFVQYLDEYTAHFNINMHTQCSVQEVIRQGDEYLVACEKKECFKAPVLLVATGIFGNPFLPDIPGVKNNSYVLHSHFYRGPEAYKQQKVLVVGAGNSAAEIAIELTGHSMVYMVTRDDLQYFSNSKKLYHVRGISESYLKELIAMEIIRYRAFQDIQEIDGGHVKFRDWELDADKIIFGTGYRGYIDLLSNFNLGVNKYNYPEVSFSGESIQYPNMFFVGPLSYQSTTSIVIHGFVKHIPRTIARIAEVMSKKSPELMELDKV